MTTREVIHEESFAVTADELFAALERPSAIRAWWGARQVIVMPEVQGLWMAAWGENDDDPDYITAATIREYDPGRRLVLGDYRYRARTGPLPFDAEFLTTFELEAMGPETRLKVTQSGFPRGEEADAFYQGCVQGWKTTFEGLRRYLEPSN